MCSSGLRGVLDSSPTKPIGMQLNYLSCREWSNDHDKQTWSEYIIHVRYKHTNQCFLFVEMREDTYETYMSINEQTKEERKTIPFLQIHSTPLFGRLLSTTLMIMMQRSVAWKLPEFSDLLLG